MSRTVTTRTTNPANLHRQNVRRTDRLIRAVLHLQDHDSLKLIGVLLFNSIKTEKAIQATQEAGKIAIKQAIKNFIPEIFDLRHQRPT